MFKHWRKAVWGVGVVLYTLIILMNIGPYDGGFWSGLTTGWMVAYLGILFFLWTERKLDERVNRVRKD